MKQSKRVDYTASLRPGKLRALLACLRAGEWWEHKLVPIIAMFYATAVMLDASLAQLWPSLLILLLALVPGAVYVSLINDFTDRAEDLAAGKPNRLAGRSAGVIFALIATPVALGLIFVILWRRDPLVRSLYLAAWLSFTLYSVAPFRLKTRGLAGVLADAAGAHLFPTLLAVVLAFRAIGQPVDLLWLGTIAAWAIAYGLRGILWHQLKDLDNDRTAGVRTFAQRHSIRAVEVFAGFAVFPVELIAFTLLLCQVGGLLPAVFLVLYATMTAARVHWWDMHATIVGSPPRFMIIMHEYYDVLFPIAALLASSLRHGADFIVLGIHLLVFPTRFARTVVECWHLLIRAGSETRLLLRRAGLQ